MMIDELAFYLLLMSIFLSTLLSESEREKIHNRRPTFRVSRYCQPCLFDAQGIFGTDSGSSQGFRLEL